jgi:hypothetical protein
MPARWAAPIRTPHLQFAGKLGKHPTHDASNIVHLLDFRALLNLHKPSNAPCSMFSSLPARFARGRKLQPYEWIEL